MSKDDTQQFPFFAKAMANATAAALTVLTLAFFDFPRSTEELVIEVLQFLAYVGLFLIYRSISTRLFGWLYT